MDMFNKLRSAVSSALPGNPLAKDFDVLNHVASGGPGLVWKIYNAIKKTTKQVCYSHYSRTPLSQTLSSTFDTVRVSNLVRTARFWNNLHQVANSHNIIKLNNFKVFGNK